MMIHEPHNASLEKQTWGLRKRTGTLLLMVLGLLSWHGVLQLDRKGKNTPSNEKTLRSPVNLSPTALADGRHRPSMCIMRSFRRDSPVNGSGVPPAPHEDSAQA
jgi:hypothetical protein